MSHLPRKWNTTERTKQNGSRFTKLTRGNTFQHRALVFCVYSKSRLCGSRIPQGLPLLSNTPRVRLSTTRVAGVAATKTNVSAREIILWSWPASTKAVSAVKIEQQKSVRAKATSHLARTTEITSIAEATSRVSAASEQATGRSTKI